MTTTLDRPAAPTAAPSGTASYRESNSNQQAQEMDDAELDALLKSMDDDDMAEQSPGVTTAGAATSRPIGNRPKASSSFGADVHERLLKADKASKFPFRRVEDVVPVTDPVDRLEALAHRISEMSSYEDARTELCALHFQLNLEGKIAPAFRPRAKVIKARNDSIYMLMHRDQIVIDCHWLHTNMSEAGLLCHNDKHRRLIHKVRAFDIPEAWAFAMEKWTDEHRATNIFSLSTLHQCQTLSLRSTVVADRAVQATGGKNSRDKSVKGLIGRVRQALNDWASRDRRITPHLTDYVNLWLARHLLSASSTPREVGQLVALMQGGRHRDDATTRDKLAKLDRALAGAFS